MQISNKAGIERRGEREDVASVAGKCHYASPRLELYGSVRMLTASGGSIGLENATGGGGCSQNAAIVCVSDRRLKENIARIGTHPLGIGLYLFDFREQYKAQMGQGRQFGVMADEAEKVLPQAVVHHADGYKMVDYRMLGIQRPTH